MTDHLNKAFEVVIKNIYASKMCKNRSRCVARAGARINDGVSLLCSFRQDIRSVTIAELLSRRNFISHSGIALWELHFYAAAAVQFRVADVTRRIFVRYVTEQRRNISFLSVVHTRDIVGKIAARQDHLSRELRRLFFYELRAKFHVRSLGEMLINDEDWFLITKFYDRFYQSS